MTPLSIHLQETWAVLIGVGTFPRDASLPPVPAVQSNLTQLKQLLSDPTIVGIPLEQIIVIEDQADILHQVVEQLPKALETLIVYYVGHGIVGKD